MNSSYTTTSEFPEVISSQGKFCYLYHFAVVYDWPLILTLNDVWLPTVSFFEKLRNTIE